MKRPKSKFFKRQKDLCRTAIANIAKRKEREEAEITAYIESEQEKDRQFIQENRLRFEMDRGGPI